MTTTEEAIRRQTSLDARRFDPRPGEPTMKAVVTVGQGGLDRLVYRDVPVPRPRDGEVLLRVLAAGVNNTEVNTRLGWYAAAVSVGTGDEAAAGRTGDPAVDGAEPASERPDGGWDRPTPFPFIQGTDCCGRVEEVGSGADAALVGRRVLVRPCMRPHGFGSPENVWLGSDFDGAFAQFVRVPRSEVFLVETDLGDAELGAVPCAYGTAENMLQRARVRAGQHVVVAGASGGVGSAAVQLAARRGATVTAIAGPAKAAGVRALGAATVVDRDADLATAIGPGAADVVVDNVSGPSFGDLLAVLCRGGVYVTSGAIAGPLVTLDKRTLYLRDLTLLGCTAWDEPVFPDLIAYIEAGDVRPAVARTYPLERIAEAQTEFLDKRHTGKLVLIPPAPAG